MTYLLLPLLAAIVFAFGSLVFKRAFAEGATVAHAVVVNNVLLAIVFLPLFRLETSPTQWHQWPLPVMTGVVFGVGHLLNVLSLRVGDVSLATPLLGAKVIFVALLGWGVFGVPLTPGQWVAAALATCGVAIIGFTDFQAGRGMGITTVLSLGCAAAFSLTDMMIQRWGGQFGTGPFLALLFGVLAVLSIGILPLLGGSRALHAPPGAWRWIFTGAALSAIQAILITATISLWRDAAGVNVVYATRGLWSLALVWFAGHWIGNTERHHSGVRAMLLRTAGAALLLTAVAVTAGFPAPRR